MVTFKIDIDSDALVQLQRKLAQFGAGSMPATSGAMKSMAGFVRNTWRGYARGGALLGVESLKRPSGGYARSIKIRKNGPFDYEIYSEAKVAAWIENGTDELDMKKTHPFGPRSRVSKPDKDGNKYSYLIVPFRWGTPKTVGFRNIMPEAVYSIVKNKLKFQQTKALMSTHQEANARGEMVDRAEYSDVSEKGIWGDRLSADMDDEVTSNMEGMSSMLGQNGKSAGYFTFRIISSRPGAKGWIKKATPPRPVTQAVAKLAEGVITDAVDAAIMQDLGL
jgi:hypothetical protein